MQIISDPLKPDFDGATRLTMLFVGVIALVVACTTTSEPEPKAQVAAPIIRHTVSRMATW